MEADVIPQDSEKRSSPSTAICKTATRYLGSKLIPPKNLKKVASKMAAMDDGNGLIPFSEAIHVETLGSGAYRANLRETFLIGSVPNGGYVASCLVRAASLHLSPRGQPHALTAHFEYLSRTDLGPALIIVEVVKPGRTLSTVHVTLYQGNLLDASPWITAGSSRKEIAAYLTMANVQQEKGLSIPAVELPLHNPPPPKPDFAALLAGRDAQWTTYDPPAGGPLKRIVCLQNLQIFAPRKGTHPKNIEDLWIRFTTGENFTTDSLAFVVDCLPYTVEMYRPSKGQNEPYPHDIFFWYPTVVMNMDLKKALAGKGVEWLRMRLQTKQIKNGRLDLEVLVYDAEGELVVLGNHVNLILGVERNTAERKGKSKM